MRKLSALTLLLLVVAGLEPVHAAPEPEPDSLAAAVKQAAKEKRVVVALFIKSADAPSADFLDSISTDAKAKAWFETNAVSCVITSDSASRVKEFFVVKFPTTVFLSGESVVLGRIEGSCAPATLLREGAAVAAGTTELAVARKAYEADSEDIDKRYALAKELAAVFDCTASLEHYLWLFDNVLSYKPSFVGVRLSFMLSAIVELGERYPTALEELRTRRDKARTKLLSAVADLEAGFDAAMDLTAINEHLGDLEDNLKVHEALTKDQKTAAGIASLVSDSCVDMLVEKKRYKEAAAMVGELAPAMNAELKELESELSMFEDLEDKEMAESLKEVTTDITRRAAARFVEIACGCADLESAGKLAGALVAKIKDGKTYAAIMDAAVRAGSKDFARKMRDEGEKAFDKEADLQPIREAAKRMDNVPGPKRFR